MTCTEIGEAEWRLAEGGKWCNLCGWTNVERMSGGKQAEIQASSDIKEANPICLNIRVLPLPCPLSLMPR